MKPVVFAYRKNSIFQSGRGINLSYCSLTLNQLAFENLSPEEPLAFDSGFETSKREAENYINQPTIKQRICEAIQSINNDLFEINRTITPVLVGAVIAEAIVMPLNPIIYAWIVLLVSRAGINQYCNS